MRALRWPVLAVVALALAAAFAGTAPAQSTAGSLSITSDQPFVPGFDRATSDYVVRCNGSALNVSVSSDPTTQVSVDGSPFQTGSWNRAVPLSTGQEFRIRVKQGLAVQTYYVRCLPSDFPNYSYERDGVPTPSLFAVTPDFGNPGGQSAQYLSVFDSNGVPVWWYKAQYPPNDAKVLADSTVAYWTGEGFYHVIGLNGQPIRNVGVVGWYTDLHELQRLDNGDYLVEAYFPRGGVDLSPFGGPKNTSVYDALIQEVTPSGVVAWSWDSANHIPLSQTPQRWYDALFQGGPPYDILHLNSLDAHDGEIVVSMRHTDAVWAINKRTGDILWKLGGVYWPGKSLSVTGDPQAAYPTGGQHDARWLPDGTLTIHDNDTGLAPALRAVRYRIDERFHTARLIESVTDPQIPFSFCCGSARRLDDGSWVASWGGWPDVAGYAPNGQRTFLLNFGGVFSYRANVLPRAISVGSLRAGMDTQYPR